MKIYYEDKAIVVAEKPPYVPAQADQSGDEDMVCLLKKHYSKKNPHQEPYIGLHHRLDRNVGGLMAFAKSKRGNTLLSDQIQNRRLKKEYLAVVCGCPPKDSSDLRHYIKKLGSRNLSKIVSQSTHGGKLAVLHYKVLETVHTDSLGSLSLLQISLETGRHHQIRVQLAHEGIPIVGDSKYNNLRIPNVKSMDLSLWAYQLTLTTAQQNEIICCSIPKTHGAFIYFKDTLNVLDKND